MLRILAYPSLGSLADARRTAGLDALQQLQLGEEIERAKDRGPTDAKVSLLGFGDEIVGGEVA